MVALLLLSARRGRGINMGVNKCLLPDAFARNECCVLAKRGLERLLSKQAIT
jgi:hypothetical protein